MKSIKFIFVLFLVASISSCTSQQKKVSDTNVVVEVVGTEVFQMIEKSAQLIDVRTPEEYSEGYIKHAKNINFYDDNFMEKMSALNKESPVYVYCKLGGRSGKAAKKLKEAGFTKVYDLDGGILQWKEKGKVITQNN